MSVDAQNAPVLGSVNSVQSSLQKAFAWDVVVVNHPQVRCPYLQRELETTEANADVQYFGELLRDLCEARIKMLASWMASPSQGLITSVLPAAVQAFDVLSIPPRARDELLSYTCELNTMDMAATEVQEMPSARLAQIQPEPPRPTLSHDTKSQDEASNTDRSKSLLQSKDRI